MAQILKFPCKPRRTARDTFIFAFTAIMTDCNCDDCRTYRALLEIDAQHAENYLLYGIVP